MSLHEMSLQEEITVQVHYTGTLDDGEVFDSSLDREPLEFEVGGGKVIPGFDDLVTGLSEGEKRKQVVPAAKAYGASPSNSCLHSTCLSNAHVCTCHRTLASDAVCLHHLLLFISHVAFCCIECSATKAYGTSPLDSCLNSVQASAAIFPIP